MTESRIITGKDGESEKLPSFIITESSRILLKSIEDNLAELLELTGLYPSDDEFYNRYRTILDLYDRLQHQVIIDSKIDIACSAGCSRCCCHWVDDMNSFEGVIISRYLKENHPEIADSVISKFREDAEILTALQVIVDEKISECSSDLNEIPDRYDLLLSCFYQLERPCALLDEDGRCAVYPVRPFTCRDYLNLRDASACHPDYINEAERATLIMSLSDIISQRIDELHHRFEEGNTDMWLRTRLVHFLTGKS